MKLSNGLKDQLLLKLLTNLRNGHPTTGTSVNDFGYRIRGFDSTKLSTTYNLASPDTAQFTSTYFQQLAPAGLVVDFGFSSHIPTTAFTIPTGTRSLKLLGAYSAIASITATIDLMVVFAVNHSSGPANKLFSQLSVTPMFITNSVVENGKQGAFVLTNTVVTAGDVVSIADFTLNLIEP